MMGFIRYLREWEISRLTATGTRVRARGLGLSSLEFPLDSAATEMEAVLAYGTSVVAGDP